MLGSDHITRLSAYTAQLQPHLPPVDTIEGSLKTKSGALGSISMSFGTTGKGGDFEIACERGVVSVSFTLVKTTIDGEETSKDVADERTGVPPEVRAWAEAIDTGKPAKRLSPREALADLELVSDHHASHQATPLNGDSSKASLSVTELQ